MRFFDWLRGTPPPVVNDADLHQRLAALTARPAYRMTHAAKRSVARQTARYAQRVYLASRKGEVAA